MPPDATGRLSLRNAKAAFERLDKVSRERALTNAESLALERAIRTLDGVNNAAPGKRFTVRELARAGIKRDMSRYR